ncbi:TonB-dependent receptor plug domain-containing protein [Zunongwangia sp.]|uniref:TonB-dependent receptor plug domain-containing protein n=1 Tax=Zunongwangia sp. TaxID=1965325 RepID=UPI003AA8CC60
MKHKQLLFLLILSIYSGSVMAQSTAITKLDTVLLKENKLDKLSLGQQVTKLTDSVLYKNEPLLTEVLRFNTPIFFKENGLGMVSSPSFRGTSASQTAIVWNGININSQFNGQLDFNTINTAAYNEIAIRPGGGSLVYGTGAIGGSVHLTNSLSFKNEEKHQALLRYGSYNTIDARYNLQLAKNDWSVNVSFSRNSSDNDYEYPDDKGKNLNGDYDNNGLNVALGYRFSNKNSLKLISEIYDGKRHFSIVRPTENRTKYRDITNRNLVEWNYEFSKFKQIVRAAFIREEYQYFDNIKSNNHTFGEAKNFIGKYDLNYKVNSKLLLNAIVQNTYTRGKGSSIRKQDRNIFSGAFLVKHQVVKNVEYEVGLRKEITNAYESPLLFSFGSDLRFSKYYMLKLNASKNFRIPTYNDLYWDSAGNPDLSPETSLQFEVGHQVTIEDLQLGVSMYYNIVKDMIIWLPGAGGNWEPDNEDKVKMYGLETFLDWKKVYSKDRVLQTNFTYAYTVSENNETDNQLIYVPFHKATANVTYQYHRFTPSLQVLYNGKVFTRSDESEKLSGYLIANIGTSYALDKHNTWQLGGQIKNLFNSEYQNVENRWMPGINFNIFLNINF